MTWLLVASLAVPTGLGFLMTAPLGRRAGRTALPLAARLALSVGLGLGVVSVGAFLFLLLYGRMSPVLIVCEAAVVLGLAGVVRARGTRGFGLVPTVHPTRPSAPPDRLAAAAFYALLAVAVVNFVLHTLNNPHGGWDAWAVWNLRARFLFEGGVGWERGFSGLLSGSSADYPLLLPAGVARIWTYLGEAAPAGAALPAFVFTFATPALLVAALHTLRGAPQAYAGGLILLAGAFFIRHGAAQYADVPLGFYILATVVLLNLHDEAPDRAPGLLRLAGMTAGLAAWTKNEGLLFLLSLVVARSLVMLTRKSSRTALAAEARAFLPACVPFLLVLLYFKTTYATPNSLLAGQDLQQTTERLTDLSRPLLIGASLVRALLTPDGLAACLLPVYAGLVGLQRSALRRKGVVTTLLILLQMLGGYFAVFLVTPANLAWHLETSLSRLLLHLWPTLLFVSMRVVAPPDPSPDR